MVEEMIYLKVIAKDGEREIIECSSEDVHRFLSDTDKGFDDNDVIAIKFLIGLSEDSMESSSWFISPEYQRAEIKEIDGSFPPELVLIHLGDNEMEEIGVDDDDVFIHNVNNYATFNIGLLSEGLQNLPDNQKLEMFFEACRENDI